STCTDSARLHGTVPVLDGDAIARGLRPQAPERAATAAGREMLRRQKEYLENGASFAVETTLAFLGQKGVLPRKGRVQCGLDTGDMITPRTCQRVIPNIG